MSGALAYNQEYEEYEIINGEVYMMSRPSIQHADIAYNITSIFKNYLKGKRCRTFGEVDVHLSEKDTVIPDAMIVCNPDIIKRKGIYGTPDLIVEILSPSTATHDKFRKKALYEKYGVKEYWIVDPFGKSIEVYRLTDGKLVLDDFLMMRRDYEWEDMTDEERTEAEQMSVKVSLYDDFIVKIKDVFEDVD